MSKPLEKLEKNILRKMREANKEAAKLLEEQIQENASLTDHKLDALEKLGFPYSIRGTQRLHRPNFQVHKQSGRLVDSIKVKAEGVDRILVGVDDTEVPYVRHVIRGTQFMIARDFITGSFNQIRGEISRIFTKKLEQGENATVDKTKANQ